jgi:hypothetical protein
MLCVLFYGAVGVVFASNWGWEKALGNAYWELGVVMFMLTLAPLLRSFFEPATHHIAYVYVSMYQALTEPRTLALCSFLCFTLLAQWRYYYAPLCLLDVVTLNARLQNVMKSIVYPAVDLLLVFLLMLIVIYIFTAHGLFFFGEMFIARDIVSEAPNNADPRTHVGEHDYVRYHSPDGGPGSLTYATSNASWGLDDATYSYSFGDVSADDGTDNAVLSGFKMDLTGPQIFTCPNLFYCYINIIDIGMRTGDIMGNAMDVVTFDDGLTYADRILWGVLFFLVVGVILFDIVTGIIIDTFSSLRQITNARAIKLNNTGFISDIDRSDYEQYGPEFKFHMLQGEEQPWENYILYMAYLRQKDPNDFTGPESEIATKLKSFDSSWFPHKMSFKIQIQQDMKKNKPKDKSDVLDSKILEITKEIKGLNTKIRDLAQLEGHKIKG